MTRGFFSGIAGSGNAMGSMARRSILEAAAGLSLSRHGWSTAHGEEEAEDGWVWSMGCANTRPRPAKAVEGASCMTSVLQVRGVTQSTCNRNQFRVVAFTCMMIP